MTGKCLVCAARIEAQDACLDAGHKRRTIQLYVARLRDHFEMRHPDVVAPALALAQVYQMCLLLDQCNVSNDDAGFNAEFKKMKTGVIEPIYPGAAAEAAAAAAAVPKQIDFGANRFAVIAADVAAAEFLRAALEQRAKVLGPLASSAQYRQPIEESAARYRETYYKAMIDAYRTGAREALRMRLGDFTPEPWTSEEARPVDLSWSPPK
jgi:hypothetical protein